MVVGLGNPGREYEDTRHNVGFRVVDLLHERARAAPLREKLGAALGEARMGSERVLLCKPMEFMNLSGQAAVRAARFWKIEPAHTIVVHDELDLPFGRMKLGAGGGAGGHNGLKSLIGEWGSPAFLRVRVGIGRPPAGRDAAGYVLSGFDAAERAQLPAVYDRAALAVETIVTRSLSEAMNRFNKKSDIASETGDGG